MRFDAAVVVITGGASGIGRRTAERLAAEGARVAIFDADEEAAHSVAAGIVEAGHHAIAEVVDVRDAEQVRSGVERTAARWGAITTLINNAAIAVADGLADISEQDWNREIDIALGGAYRCTKAVLPAMIEHGGGVIVNVGSVNGIAMYGQEPYSAAKAGIDSLTRSIAVRYGPAGIRANTVVPGTIATPAWTSRVQANPDIFDELARWYPLGRVGSADDVASAICFLASDEASWITGTSLVVDGGLTAGGFGMMQTAVGDR
ncbi:glucose 1-dehydrogenase [Haloactinopolyspora sp.]|uniref:SDR family NAD(P)-dependent oxidoreductase n=1 Tax=Haloactinopolyspora sp. TaxID=1966353 RepID=UPI00262F51D4|nr:glucose 1-dehydrogenase [Haloactinopolyspora sp.]